MYAIHFPDLHSVYLSKHFSVFWEMANHGDDGSRLYQCLRKYKLMAKQFDELIEMMDSRTTQASRRRKLSSTTAVAAVSATQPDSNEALVQTITRFLHELNANPDSNPNPNLPVRSASTRHSNNP